MSYSEENGQVVLKMSREDYELLIRVLGKGTTDFFRKFLNRLNQGNPNYRPYQVEEK